MPFNWKPRFTSTKNLWKLMLLEEQTAGRKQDPQSLGLIWCFCNVIPHTRESTQSTTALWHSCLLCSCLTLSAPCNLQKYWTLLSALSLHSTSQAPLTWEPCPSWYRALTEVYNYHCTPWGKHRHILTKDYCISQKRVNNQTAEIKTSKITKLNVKMNISKNCKWTF